MVKLVKASGSRCLLPMPALCGCFALWGLRGLFSAYWGARGNYLSFWACSLCFLLYRVERDRRSAHAYYEHMVDGMCRSCSERSVGKFR